MEKADFKGSNNTVKTIFLILCYLSWLLVSVNNLASLKWMYNCKDETSSNFIWNIGIRIPSISAGQILEYDQNYIPLKMDEMMIYIVFNFSFVIIFIGCVVFIIKTTIKKDDYVMEGMMGPISQFHFIPLLCAFVMTLLSEIVDGDNGKNITYTGLAFSIVGLASMIFIYINTNLRNKDWWTKFCLKEGSFSCLIILFWYNFCYVIYQVRVADKGDKDIKNWQKGCSLAFSIIFGIGSLAFSYTFKDIMISFMNVLIYIGLFAYYCGLEGTTTKDYNKNGEAAIDMIILICSIILFFYLIIDYIKNEITEMKSQIFNLGQVQTQTIVKVNANSDEINFIANNINLPTRAGENFEKK